MQSSLPSLVSYLSHEVVDVILRHRDCGGGTHGVLHVRRLNVQILKLLLELVHQRRDLDRTKIALFKGFGSIKDTLELPTQQR